jgi:endonuclease/exonuclease/phosphatase family metal-dependent hydrolase
MIVVKEGLLPGTNPSAPGSALWMKIRFEDSNLHIVNTQLGLGLPDRSLQIDSLLSKDWIEHPLCSGPLVLCGDFNLLEGSSHYVKLISKFSDIGLETEHGKSGRTYRGVLRFDYIFINSGRLRTVGISTPHTHLTKVASDHFPIVADLEIC